jgi:mono/diheme cytochrome c family protein
MKRWATTLVLSLVIAAAMLTGVGLVALRGGISARPEPSTAEAEVARRMRHLAIPASDRALNNPFAKSSPALIAGQAHFADHCAVCHGNDGKGLAQFGRGLYPRPPDLTRPATQDLSDGELFYIIENGVRFTGMPAFHVEGASDLSWHLVTFVRHLPSLSQDERHEMERLNPRSPAEWRELQEEEGFLNGPADAQPGLKPK